MQSVSYAMPESWCLLPPRLPLSYREGRFLWQRSQLVMLQTLEVPNEQTTLNTSTVHCKQSINTDSLFMHL